MRVLQEEEEWVPGIVKAKEDRSYTVVTTSGSVIQVALSDDERIQAMNKQKTVAIDDMIHLTFLNEPEILHCLELRYDHNLIYTYTGPILIAINPFKVLEIYNQQVLDMYRNYGILQAQGLLESIGIHALPPHLYSIADQLYHKMYAVLSNDFSHNSNANQIVLISGESGAGKTEATKYILRYLTSLSDQLTTSTGTTSSTTKSLISNIMEKVVQSNPILEAFGNAKTLKNENSSRFGKFIELYYHQRGQMIGGRIQTYLLENSRICIQHEGERNYHIFYQMFAGLTPEELEQYNLSMNLSWNYLHQGKVGEMHSINDKHNYFELQRALKTFHLFEMNKEIFSLLAGIVHLGQINVLDDGDDGSQIDEKSSKHTASSCKCFGILESSICSLLTQRQMKTKFECITKKLTSAQAVDTRDSLAKTIYKRLFHW